MPVQGGLFSVKPVESCTIYNKCLGFGNFNLNHFKNTQSAMMISLMGLMLPVILLSGFIFPISSMPVPLQII